MDDDILREINRLAGEEHELAQTTVGSPQAQLDRRRELEMQLDQCWDLLRQRRALRRAGVDPADAVVRPAGVVTGYQQ